MTRDVTKEIRDEIATHRIVLYMKGTALAPRCGFSAVTADILSRIGRPFHVVNVLDDQEKWAAIKAFSDWPTIPQVYVAGKFIGGCDITRDLHASGELQRLIDAAFAR
ncbi:MAG: Grx4 family monothiol glutaredoxin [Acidobacteria bacterium]|nr:Grx4 family monothiol glutaredoxin [Acidobacteriota bacterium]